MTSGAMRELKFLLSALLLLGMEETAWKLQHIGETFQLSQIAAVKLANDAMSTEIIDDSTYALDRYLKKVKHEEYDSSEASSWRSKILFSP